MTQIIIDFEKSENVKISKFSKKWRLTKNQTVKRIVKEFVEKVVKKVREPK